MPSPGIILNLALFLYMLIFECFKEGHVSCVRAGILLAQAWIFICASVAIDSDEDLGSDMLGGWIVFLIAGYLIMLAKLLICKRKTRKVPVERN